MKKSGKYSNLMRLSLTAIVFCVIFAGNAYSQDYNLDDAYSYLNDGMYPEAVEIFEGYVSENPDATNIYLQLGYIYKKMDNNDKAVESFTYVKNNSYSQEEIDAANMELEYVSASEKNERLNAGYTYLNNGETDKAVEVFKTYLDENPNDDQTMLQLAYIYSNKRDYDSALVYLENVKYRSRIPSNVELANKEIKSITDMKDAGAGSPQLDSAYALLNDGKKNDAIRLFKEYADTNPNDTKVRLQLGYLYAEKKQYSTAKKYFKYVEQNSTNSEEIKQAKTSIDNITDFRFPLNRNYVDIYFYNYYDTQQENYISNFIGKYKYLLAPNLYTGIYTDVYLDSRSKPGQIYNDRFVEGGAFFQYSFFPSLSFELRLGYVRQIDQNKNSFNYKPILTFADRFGSFPEYKSMSIKKKQHFFLETYAATLYDYKYRNFFAQGQVREVLRFLTGGYSFLDFYLKQNVQGDSKQLAYNNYGEFGGGIAFRPDIQSFPTLFIEATNRFYFVRDDNNLFPESAFQVKLGFLLNYFSSL